MQIERQSAIMLLVSDDCEVTTRNISVDYRLSPSTSFLLTWHSVRYAGISPVVDTGISGRFATNVSPGVAWDEID